MKYITVDGLREITYRLVTFTAETFDDGCAHAFVVDACGRWVCVMPDVSMQDKDCFAQAVAQVAEKADAVAVLVVAKSWVTGDAACRGRNRRWHGGASLADS